MSAIDEIIRNMPDLHNNLSHIAEHSEKITAEIGAVALRMDAQTACLYHIQQELRALRLALATENGPAFNRPLLNYSSDEWIQEIGAEVITRDSSGPAIVSYAGHQWKRRSGSGRFGMAIWFSRTAGKDGEDGTPNYTRLITFKNVEEPEPLDHKIAAHLAAQVAASSQPDALSQHFDHQEEDQSAKLLYGDETEVGNNAAEITAFTAFETEKERVPNDPEELREWYKKNNGK